MGTLLVRAGITTTEATTQEVVAISTWQNTTHRVHLTRHWCALWCDQSHRHGHALVPLVPLTTTTTTVGLECTGCHWLPLIVTLAPTETLCSAQVSQESTEVTASEEQRWVNRTSATTAATDSSDTTAATVVSNGSYHKPENHSLEI